jgi:hypothetical protein
MVESLKSKSVNAEALIVHWRNDPVAAAEDIFGIELDQHQRVVLQQMWFLDTQFNILSRGCGKTFLSAVCASLEGILKPSYRVGLIGPSYRQAKFLWAEVEKLWEISPIFQEATVKAPAITPEKCYIKFKSAPGRTGSVIEALPMGSDGGKIRGARYFSVYPDEAAQIDGQVLDIVVRGFMATSANPMERVRILREQRALVEQGLLTEDQVLRPPANKMVYSTTAFYQYNHIWERLSRLMDALKHGKRNADRGKGGNPADYTFRGAELNGGQIPHKVMADKQKGLCAFTCLDPSEGFINMDSIREAKRDMSEYQFLMEYFALFPPDSEGFFRRSLLDAARQHRQFGPIHEPRPGMLYTMGVDPARTGDNFAIAIFEIDLDTDTIRLVKVISWNKKDFPLCHKYVRYYKKLYKMDFFKMDAGGGGTTVRDLLANQDLCPSGEKPILEIDFDEHRALRGDRHLGPLCQFSNYQWVHDANNNLLSGLQHGQLKIASKPPLPGQIVLPIDDEADDEMEKALSEWASIITIKAGQRMRWDTPTETMRKDRYSAILIGYDAALTVLGDRKRPKTLSGGFWA